MRVYSPSGHYTEASAFNRTINDYYHVNGANTIEAYYPLGIISATSGATVTISGNTLYAFPIMFNEDMFITRIGVEVTTAVANSNIRIGFYSTVSQNRDKAVSYPITGSASSGSFYSHGDYRPGSLIKEVGTVRSSVVQGEFYTGHFKLCANQLYYCAFVASHTPGLSATNASSPTYGCGVMGFNRTFPIRPNLLYSHAFTYGALPSEYPLTTALEMINTSPAFPVIYVTYG